MHPLDNVIWQALTSRQAVFAEAYGEARKFPREVSPLAGFREASSEGYLSLAQLLAVGATVSLFLAQPHTERPGWHVIANEPLLQMVREQADTPSTPDAAHGEFSELTAADSSEMVELAALTKPGPFDNRTHELGSYVGIRREGVLVAMAGERLKVPGYTEVSAVCTHPSHTGHGYARMLMLEVMKRITSAGETPFLHVRKNNVRAIDLYHRLGFKLRAYVHLAVLRKV